MSTALAITDVPLDHSAEPFVLDSLPQDRSWALMDTMSMVDSQAFYGDGYEPIRSVRDKEQSYTIDMRHIQMANHSMCTNLSAACRH